MLKKPHDEIEAILSSLVTILIGVSANDIITNWNSIAELTFSIPASKIIGKSFMHCGLNWDWERVFEGISISISEMKPIRLDDLSFVDQNNINGFLDIRINPITEKDGSLKGFLINGEDISKRKQLEWQLAQAQKLESIGQLSSGIAHEINTPTQYITDNVSFLKDAFSDILKILKHNIDLVKSNYNGKGIEDLIKKLKSTISRIDLDYLIEEIPKAIEQSVEGLGRAAKIVKSMKQFSHPGTDTKILIDVNRALDDTITITRNEWKYTAEVVTHYNGNLPSVLCNPGELDQVFLNIIINASDAIKEKHDPDSEEKGLIDISTWLEDGWIFIQISDTGIGIPEGIRDRIFDPFFTTKEVGKSSGQGLSIVYDIVVNRNKGKINYKTKTGKGTTCIIRLSAFNSKNESRIKEERCMI